MNITVFCNPHNKPHLFSLYQVPLWPISLLFKRFSLQFIIFVLNLSRMLTRSHADTKISLIFLENINSLLKKAFPQMEPYKAWVLHECLLGTQPSCYSPQTGDLSPPPPRRVPATSMTTIGALCIPPLHVATSSRIILRKSYKLCKNLLHNEKALEKIQHHTFSFCKIYTKRGQQPIFSRQHTDFVLYLRQCA